MPLGSEVVNTVKIIGNNFNLELKFEGEKTLSEVLNGSGHDVPPGVTFRDGSTSEVVEPEATLSSDRVLHAAKPSTSG
jgi:hypothetical protein